MFRNNKFQIFLTMFLLWSFTFAFALAVRSMDNGNVALFRAFGMLIFGAPILTLIIGKLWSYRLHIEPASQHKNEESRTKQKKRKRRLMDERTEHLMHDDYAAEDDYRALADNHN